jgi:hypothetical protein
MTSRYPPCAVCAAQGVFHPPHQSVTHDDLPVAQACELLIVSRDQEDLAFLAADLGDQIYGLERRGAVAVAGGFIGQHPPWGG